MSCVTKKMLLDLFVHIYFKMNEEISHSSPWEEPEGARPARSERKLEKPENGSSYNCLNPGVKSLLTLIQRDFSKY